jgi:hypothetical protein
VVDAPNRRIAVVEHQSLAHTSPPEQYDAGDRDPLRPSRRHRGQIDGAPEDGDAYYQKSTTETE